MSTASTLRPIEILVDADACPVKEEIYKVARRYRLKVRVVANGFMMVPVDPLIERVLVDARMDAADDWIVAHCRPGDIVITTDILLASRCLKAGAEVIGPTGRPFTDDSIGMAVANRGIQEHLRAMGETTRGPRPFAAGDRSRFLSALDEAVNRSLRRRGT